MKVKAAFEHPNTGEMLSPGQSFDEKGLDKEEIEDLKERGYIADGEGHKAGEKPDLQKMASSDLVNLAKSKGIDTGPLRNRTQIINAINMKEPAAAPASDQKQASITFGPKVRPTTEEKTVSAEDYKKQQEEREKSRKEQEENRLQGSGGGRGPGRPAGGGAAHSRGEK